MKKKNLLIGLIVLIGLVLILHKLFLNIPNLKITNLQKPVGNMLKARLTPNIVLLKNGDVLVLGGAGKSTELYSPAQRKFSYVGNINYIRNYYTTTLLQNGNVLITGGFNTKKADFISIVSSEIYDSKKKTFYLSGNMIHPRAEHSAVLLKNGMVLITGGKDESTSKVIPSAELYNPNKSIFIESAKMCVPRYRHSSILLSNGKVLIVGGKDLKHKITNSMELYDPITNVFKCIGNISNKYEIQNPTILNDGKVFVIGGGAGIYKPNSNNFTSINNKNFIQVNPFTLQLNDNNLLIISKEPIYFGAFKENNTALYNLKTGKYTPLNTILDGRRFPSIIQLKDKTILILGGCTRQGINNSSAYIVDTIDLRQEK